MLYDLGKNTINDMQKELANAEPDLPLVKMLELLPDGLVYYEAVRDKASRLVDFRLRFYNQQFTAFAPPPYQLAIGICILEDNPDYQQLLKPLVTRYQRVVETGKLDEFNFYDPYQNSLVALRVCKLNDGVLVTARMVNKSEVSESEKQATAFRELLDGSINGIMSYQSIRDNQEKLIDFRLQSVNKAAEEILGQQAEDIIGKTLMELYPEEFDMGLFDLYCQTVETGQLMRQQVCYTEKNGDLWLDLVANRFNDGLIVYFIDITDARQAQEMVRNQATLFTTMSQSVPDLGVLVCDPNFRILFANGDLPDIFLQSKAALIGKPLEEVMPIEMATHTRQNFSDALAGRSRYMNEEIADQYYEVFVGPVNDSENRTVMAVATLRNITSVKRAYQQLESSIQELKRSNQNLEQFAYIASHDLQEPLRKIQSFGDLLRDQYDAIIGEQGGDLIRRMQTAAARMSILIRDLLTYSRIASHKEVFQAVDLNQLVVEVLDDLETVIREKKATIQVDQLPVVWGSALQLRQLFQNLLSNSLKFNRIGVQPLITIKNQYRSNSGFSSPSESTKNPVSYTEITVADNGIGFEPDQADRIFQVFQRLHGRNEFSGTGIGLAIVQKVIENHHGRIQATAIPGSGATFTMLLPVQQ